MQFIGLDIGTTSISGLVYDLDQQSVLHTITRKNTGALQGSAPWERIQDPEEIWQRLHAIVASLLERVPGVQGIGLTGQMHGIVYTTTDGKHAGPLYTWQDQRGSLPYEGQSSYAKWLSAETGYELSAGYGLATHFYNLQNKLVPAHAASFCTIADYAAMRLTGATRPLIDVTQAAGIGGFSTRLGDFDRQALSGTGMNLELLPQVVPSGTMLGRTSSGIPVFTSLGDNQASFLGSVQKPEEAVLLNIGTGGQLSVFRAEDCLPPAGLEPRPFPGGGTLLVGASLCGGKSYAVLEGLFRQIIEAYTGMPAPDIYSFMNGLLLHAPKEADSLQVNTQFLGTRQQPEQRGSIAGITLDNLTPGGLTHAFLQGMTDELYAYYEQIQREYGTTFRLLIGSGNGLRANPILRDKAESSFGLPLYWTASSEEGGVGAALSAAVGLGVVRNFSEAGQYLRYEQKTQ